MRRQRDLQAAAATASHMCMGQESGGVGNRVVTGSRVHCATERMPHDDDKKRGRWRRWNKRKQSKKSLCYDRRDPSSRVYRTGTAAGRVPRQLAPRAHRTSIASPGAKRPPSASPMRTSS
jgi:hypothetical protein